MVARQFVHTPLPHFVMHENDILNTLALTPPDELPIGAHWDELILLLHEHQVVIVAGETGCGKTTQLPKICLAAGRGSRGIIGCTQPRRIAALSVADRVATELGRPELVGSKIRFHDRTGRDTRIKFMTDGVLLAEMQRDRRLAAYDTLIIDEAHERSLNIDFLLGSLQQLLPRRPGLKLIVSSATMDTARFAAFFGGAPVVTVAGRRHPVTIRHLEAETSAGDEEIDHLELTVRETRLLAEGKEPGDILVFLPTERDIREVQGALAKDLPRCLVLPLYGRLATGDQRRIFAPSGRRKIVLATNVAETSITVPGIRFVVDSGLARLARYHPRSRSASLRVERISRASCDQRAGRCGRTGPGLCIRLYGEEDYQSREAFTPPEIQRANLAEVILRMASLRLGDPARFPFPDPPSGRAIQDGSQLLRELGALNEHNHLTEHGRLMARLPLDPCLSRMLIEARELDCLHDTTIIAAALAVQDPRIRPPDKEQAAAEAHARFHDPGSDFLTLCNIWRAFHEVAGKVGSGRLKKFCQGHFLSWQRIREWIDVRQQLTDILAAELELPPAFEKKAEADAADAVHQAVTSGLLRNIGQLNKDKKYTLAGGREGVVFPGSVLHRKTPAWIVAAAVVQTSQLFARTVAGIDPAWLERLGGELCRKSWTHPHWEKHSGQVIASERVTLFGLVIVPARPVNYGRLHETARLEAQEIFVREALVAGELGGRYEFLTHNLRLVEERRELEERLRRRGFVVDEEVLRGFYRRRLDGVYDRFTLNRWLKRHGDRALRLRPEDIAAAEVDDDALHAFPPTIDLGPGPLQLAYRFEPGHEQDGVTATVPLSLLPRIDPERCERLVPGLIPEKILALLKGLPKGLRRNLVPLPDAADRLHDEVGRDGGPLYPALERAILKLYHTTVRREDWPGAALPPHLRLRLAVVDEQGRELAAGRSLDELRDRLRGGEGRTEAAPGRPERLLRPSVTDWDFADIAAQIPVLRQGVLETVLLPTLVADPRQGGISLQALPDSAERRRLQHEGLIALYRLRLAPECRQLARECRAMVAMHTASWLMLGERISAAALAERLERRLLQELLELPPAEEETPLPSRAGFAAVVSRLAGGGMSRLAREQTQKILDALALRRRLLELAERHGGRAPALRERFCQWVDELVPPDFLDRLDTTALTQLPRRGRALELRLERAANAPAKDEAKAARLAPFVNRLATMPKSWRPGPTGRELLAQYRHMVEEFKISLFAPELGTLMPVSEKRLQEAWRLVEESCRRAE